MRRSAILALILLLLLCARARATEGFTQRPCSLPAPFVLDGTGNAYASYAGRLWTLPPAAWATLNKTYGQIRHATVAPASLRSCPKGATLATAVQLKWIADKLGLKPIGCSIPENAVVQCPGAPTTYVKRQGKLLQYSYDSWVAAGQPPPQILSCDELARCPKGGAVPYKPTQAPGLPTTATCFNQGNDSFGGRGCGPDLAVDPRGFNTAISSTFCAKLGIGGVCIASSGTSPTGAGCGRYIDVTNIETGAKARVMIVDARGTGEGHGLDLAYTAFTALDTSGAGLQRGYLNVTVSLAR